MSLFIASLNSGSNGNCYYVGNEQEAILIDAGISCREIEKRMKRLGLPMEKVKALFISHEHGDHISGVSVLAKKFNLPVYITTPTLSNSRIQVEKKLIKPFIAHQSIQIGNLAITAFPKLHDASDPHSFIVRSKSITVGVFTDIGIACNHLVGYFQQCHAAFLESNYDVNMLENGNYPLHLKNRIRGGEGHLSNDQALELFLNHKPAFLSHLILSHLSKNNNDPKLVEELFNEKKGNTKIIVASRYKESALYALHSEGSFSTILAKKKNKIEQLSLF